MPQDFSFHKPRRLRRPASPDELIQIPDKIDAPVPRASGGHGPAAQVGPASSVVARGFTNAFPSTQVTPFFQFHWRAYTNTAGTNTPIVNVTVQTGRALVVSSLVCVALQSAADGTYGLLGTDNPYLFAGLIAFQPTSEKSLSSLGQYGSALVGTGSFAGISIINTNLGDLLGWGATNPGIVVGSGGSFGITAFSLDVIAAGANIPTHVGVRIGGFMCPQTFALEMLERGGA